MAGKRALAAALTGAIVLAGSAQAASFRSCSFGRGAPACCCPSPEPERGPTARAPCCCGAVRLDPALAPARAEQAPSPQCVAVASVERLDGQAVPGISRDRSVGANGPLDGIARYLLYASVRR
ncbi:MAG: hypothetical protein HYY06_24670 [Deltaproteobacteria bacterium]|nr:hypothetical protein [Deltaproteobacteria bacterium]